MTLPIDRAADQARSAGAVNRRPSSPRRLIRRWMGTVVLLIEIFFTALVPTARADERIRVALIENGAEVSLSGKLEGRPLAAAGRKTGDASPLSITVGRRGLILNGRPTDLSEWAASGGEEGIGVNQSLYRGEVRVHKTGGGLTVINELDLEDYLRGVVPVEISTDWSPEVLKVQAVIARTYAVYKKRANPGKNHDLLATTADQVYSGRGVEHPAGDRAVALTRGWILTYDGRPILSAYHSTSAGPTESAAELLGEDLPYLKGVSCPFDQGSPYYHWTQTFSFDDLQAFFRQAGLPVGTIASLTPFQWTRAGRVDRIRVIHSLGETILKAPEFRKIMGFTKIRSTRFSIENFGRELKIRGMGAGHGLGLCQWGAKEMAQMGYTYDKILDYYYPGATLEPMAPLLPEGPPQ